MSCAPLAAASRTFASACFRLAGFEAPTSICSSAILTFPGAGGFSPSHAACDADAANAAAPQPTAAPASTPLRAADWISRPTSSLGMCIAASTPMPRSSAVHLRKFRQRTIS
jgi:hypothetical protein